MLLPILLLVCLWLRRRCVHTAASPAMPPPTMMILNVMMIALLQLLSIRRSEGDIAPFCYYRSIKAASISRRRPTLGAHLGAPRALRTLTNSATSRRSKPLTIPEPKDNLTKIQIHEDKYRLNPTPYPNPHTHTSQRTSTQTSTTTITTTSNQNVHHSHYHHHNHDHHRGASQSPRLRPRPKPHAPRRQTHQLRRLPRCTEPRRLRRHQGSDST